MVGMNALTPALYIGHGAPPLLDDAVWSGQLAAWANDLPRPAAILVVSAHWESAPIMLSAQGVGLVYDFGGFATKYYQMRYDTPDASALAARVAALMPDTEPVHQSTTRGLDHGAWVPLKIMYPAADVPVIQLSMPSLDPVALLTLGERLRHLREEGVLVIGSGFMTHSFAVMRDPRLLGHITAFDEWAADALSRGDVDALTDYQHKAPGAGVAHPTADHFVPLLLTLGAAHDPHRVTNAIERVTFGNSIRSLQVA